MADYASRRAKFNGPHNQEEGMSIFNKDKDNGQVQVPSIEVRGDELRVEDEKQNQQPDDKRYRLPKTKWFS